MTAEVADCPCWKDANPPAGAKCRLCGRTAPGVSAHMCHARGCRVPVKPTLLMCPDHWRRVPAAIQRAVYATYRHGQCDDKKPSRQWHEAASAAIGYVAIKEKRIVSAAEVVALGALGYMTTTDAEGELIVTKR